MGVFNLEEQIGFYAQYHHDRINQLIHIVFVPTILWTVLVWASFTGPIGGVDLETYGIPKEMLTLDGSLCIALVYAVFYLILEPVAGFLYSFFLFGLLLAVKSFVAAFPEEAIKYTIGIHIFSWIIQFIGHGVFEKRAPALLDSLVQALLLAPLFVWLEVLFMFGYRPALANRIDKNAARAIHEYKKASEKKQK
eukprot:Nk52_evm40s236 gene=Nk52_evmTU40s236